MEVQISVQFSCSVTSNSLRHHGLQHIWFPCPTPTLGTCSNSGPMCRWCHSTLSFSVIPSPPAFNLVHRQGLYQWVSPLHQVAKVLEFQLQHPYFSVCSGLIFFSIDCFDLLAVQGTLKNLLQHHSLKATVWLSAFFIVQPLIHTWPLEKP